MAWTAPMTAVSNSIFLASQFNTYVRDNLNETMVAKATAAGQYFVGTGPNALKAYTPSTITTTTTQQNVASSGTFVDLTSTALAVTTNTTALIHIAAWMQVSSNDTAGIVTFRVSGATTLGQGDHPNKITIDGVLANNGSRQSSWGHLTKLLPGSNTFTMQAFTNATTINVNYCNIIVIPTN